MAIDSLVMSARQRDWRPRQIFQRQRSRACVLGRREVFFALTGSGRCMGIGGPDSAGVAAGVLRHGVLRPQLGDDGVAVALEKQTSPLAVWRTALPSSR